jgi:WD40 repeat protein
LNGIRLPVRSLAYLGKIVSKTIITDSVVEVVEYSPDGLTFALGLKDSSIRIFDAITKVELLRLGGVESKVTGHMNKVCALKFYKNNPKILLSGSGDTNLLFWDLNSIEL